MALAEQAPESLETGVRNWHVVPAIDVAGYNVDTEAAVWTLKAIQETDVQPPIAPVILRLKHRLPPYSLLRIISAANERPEGIAYKRGNVSVAAIACHAAYPNELRLQRIALHELQHVADFSSPKWIAEQKHYLATKADRYRKFWDTLSAPMDLLVKTICKSIDNSFELDPELTTANYVQAVNIVRKSPWERRARATERRYSEFPKIIHINQTKYEQQ